MQQPPPDAAELARQLGELATRLGPAVRPVGTEALLSSITETARRLFGATACSLALLSADESELVYTTAAGDGADSVTGMRLPSGTGVAGWVVLSGQPVAVADAQADSRFARDVAEHTGYVPRALLAVPVVADERVLGVLTLLDRDESRPGAEDDMALLSVFADQTALTLQHERAFADLGGVLLRALASAAGGGTLQDALEAAAEQEQESDSDLAELASLIGELGRQGPAERRLALRLVREVAGYTARRSPRPAG
ncbi:GAF domain-containing protein [Motilibacter peucedani]|uniref:GAF domain-containing protein n=1 Tax=Motilibacter peucedani TaxID=598650 RepID=A0A420XJT1_9ACTN|nr:GAF domain-containing protein [Motilibacter peucedani]RKS68011.1 GAF domain-containing protein [Motilibacter peucedani]